VASITSRNAPKPADRTGGPWCQVATVETTASRPPGALCAPPCNGGTNQQFFFDLVGSYTGKVYMRVNVNSDLHLGVLDSSTTTGAAAVQVTGTGLASQKWTIS
jgi:hypothetical protein